MSGIRVRLPAHLANHRAALRSLSAKELKLLSGTRPYKVIVASDIHGPLVDQRAFSCFLRVLEAIDCDKVILNGDVFDFPYISRHTKKIIEDSPLLDGYSEINEILFVRDNVLKPIKELVGDKEVICRIGNHEERFIKPKKTGAVAEALVSVYHRFKSQDFEHIIGFKELGVTYDPSAKLTLFNAVKIVHGVSIAQNAAQKNILRYFSNGCSGHTHRLGIHHYKTEDNVYFWVESGCLRTLDAEYAPTAVPMNWQQGFVILDFYQVGDSVKVFAQPIHIHEGKCSVNGRLIQAS